MADHVEVSEEQLAPVGDGIELCFQTFGSPDADPLLLVMGLGGPMTWWDERLCRQLADAGFFVIRYDNRDVGRSTRVEGRVSMSMLTRAFLGLRTRAPYTLDDLARDALGLLDHLGIVAAHVWGVSMGGMIAQTLAVAHPDRVRSLTSMMSTTGARTVGFQHPSLLPTFLSRSGDEAGYVEASVRTWRIIGSPGYPVTEEDVRRRATETYERGVSSQATARQMLAVLTQPNRTRDLSRVTVPTLVVHGLADRMVHVSGGRATSLAVPRSELLLIDGLGHDIPERLWPTLVKAVRRNADRAA
ncbi:Pimeloyl-ACP methyl ester carboxylesterase [Nocardioides terrae]|uniref:Pimeloyl-ACP methyl ester carboxylesterase n=1 Tax=Nocardioides terrae TaxID=574651 RepID=A0A1I1E156_9ACTN|nr:alpha/beta fold hydrolase [Nocardioides terrae]SFB78968.1 Pimeloyl-ACP methyl ester carboxylesterase [Nocardioides terrae]